MNLSRTPTLSDSAAAVKPAFRTATRINRSFTARLEKQVLTFLGHRAPAWLTSDHLTALGLAAQLAAGASFALARVHPLALFAVIFCTALNWLGDSLDGTLARVRNQQRPRFGFYVDHLVDLIGAVALMAGLGCSGFAHWPVVVAMLVAFLLLAAESFLATYTLALFQLSQGLFGPTEIRILLCLGCLALLHSPYVHIAGQRLLLFDVGGSIASLFMFASFLWTGFRHTAALYRDEPVQTGLPVDGEAFIVGVNGRPQKPMELA